MPVQMGCCLVRIDCNQKKCEVLKGPQKIQTKPQQTNKNMPSVQAFREVVPGAITRLHR